MTSIASRKHHGPGARRSLALLVASLLLTALTLPAFADDLSWWKARRINNDADDALEHGDHQKAAELYQELIDGLDRDNDRRGEALYGAAIAELNVGHRAAAAELLRELLRDFPGHDHAMNARALSLLLDGASAAPAGEPETEPTETEAEEPTSEGDRVARLESKVTRLEGELQQAREELQKKEEAIEKLKELVVGEGGS